MFISEAMAASDAATAQSPMAGFFIQLILVFVIFYFLLIRPQQKKMKEHEDMLNSIKIKDEVLTGGGVYGSVTKIEADALFVEIAKGVEIKVLRSSVREVVSDTKSKSEKK